MSLQTSIWYEILDIARWAPTPHNTQAYKIQVTDSNRALLVADTKCHLPATDPRGQFLYVGAGVFTETMRVVAASKGYELLTEYEHIEDGDKEFKPLIRLTLKQLQRNSDFDPQLILDRRTSRLPFDGVPVGIQSRERIELEATKSKHELGLSDDRVDINAVLRFNTKILFHDLNHTGLRTELMRWIRWSKEEYKQKKDGFSVAALNQNTVLMWLFMHSFWVLRLPLISKWVQRRYEKAISGVATVGWLKGPFATKQDWVYAGELLARMWLIATEEGLYMQPFGSVITNDEAREWVLEQLKLTEAAGEMCWLVFRIGTGPEPPRSLRRETKEYFV